MHARKSNAIPASRRVVYAAVAANAGIAIAKFIVAAIGGSSAMLAEGIHSTVDTFNEGLLLIGQRRSKRTADDLHPFGHGKEVYFWSLLVAVLLFGLGGGMAIYEGITHLLHPHAIQSLWETYLVLGIAAAFEGTSFVIAFRALGAQRDGRNPLKWWLRVRRSKDPAVFTVFVEDFTALTGILIAFVGVTAGALLNNPYIDGIASLLIGGTLATAAVALAHETRNLLIGERAALPIVESIDGIVSADPDVVGHDAPLTMQLGPEEILVNVDVRLRDGLGGAEQIGALDRIGRDIRKRHPEVVHVSLQPRPQH